MVGFLIFFSNVVIVLWQLYGVALGTMSPSHCDISFKTFGLSYLDSRKHLINRLFCNEFRQPTFAQGYLGVSFSKADVLGPLSLKRNIQATVDARNFELEKVPRA